MLDTAAFEALFDAHFDELRRYVYRFVLSWDGAEDIVHDVFLRVWEKRAALAGVTDYRSYLYATAHHHAMNYLRHGRVEQRWRERQASPARLEEHTAASDDPEEALASAELMAALQRAIDELPPRQREVMLLRWRHHSYDDIAAQLDISPKTVAIHLGRAFEHLRRILPRLL